MSRTVEGLSIQGAERGICHFHGLHSGDLLYSVSNHFFPYNNCHCLRILKLVYFHNCSKFCHLDFQSCHSISGTFGTRNTSVLIK